MNASCRGRRLGSCKDYWPALVSIGFLGLFAVVGLPVSFGVALVVRAVPRAGLATGGLLALVGLAALAGRRIALPLHLQVPVKKERRFGAMLQFGVGCGAASLGCTLPLFLTLIAASSGPDKATVFVAYAAGTAVVLMALAVLVALAHEGVARAVRPALPYMNRIAGLLLVIAGGYSSTTGRGSASVLRSGCRCSRATPAQLGIATCSTIRVSARSGTAAALPASGSPNKGSADSADLETLISVSSSGDAEAVRLDGRDVLLRLYL